MKQSIVFSTILGNIKLTEENNRIIELQFTDKKENKYHQTPILLECEKQIKQYLKGKLKTFNCPITLQGTEFQKKVWQTLLQIPYGKIWTYKKLSAQIGKPLAYRAVANANRENKIPIIIPCHRVIGSNNHLKGYRSGIDKKIFLLQLEGHKIKNNYIIQ